MEKLIIIKGYLEPAEANMMHNVLAAEDVYSFLKDEHSVVMTPFLANSMGGIKLMVREADAEKAVEILKEAGYLKEDMQPEKKFTRSILPVLILIVILLLLGLYEFVK